MQLVEAKYASISEHLESGILFGNNHDRRILTIKVSAKVSETQCGSNMMSELTLRGQISAFSWLAYYCEDQGPGTRGIGQSVDRVYGR